MKLHFLYIDAETDNLESKSISFKNMLIFFEETAKVRKLIKKGEEIIVKD